MLRPYMSGTSFLCRLRPTVTPFPLWTALPSPEYYEVIRLPEGHRPGSLLVAVAYRLELPLSFRVRPTVCRGFPQCVAHYPYPVPKLLFKLEPTGAPKFLTLLSTPPTL